MHAARKILGTIFIGMFRKLTGLDNGADLHYYITTQLLRQALLGGAMI